MGRIVRNAASWVASVSYCSGERMGVRREGLGRDDDDGSLGWRFELDLSGRVYDSTC